MALKIAVTNMRKGVGSTTTTYNLAASIMRNTAQKVLQIDLDPQCDLSVSCGMCPDDPRLGGYSACSLFQNGIDPLKCCFLVDSILDNTRLFAVPSTADLVHISNDPDAMNAFQENIRILDEQFDFILFDCPPLYPFSAAVLSSSDKVIIPATPESLSFRSLGITRDAIQKARKSSNGDKDLETLELIVTMYGSQDSAHGEILQKLKRYCHVLDVIPYSRMIRIGSAEDLPVVISNPRSPAAKKYKDIAKRLCVNPDKVGTPEKEKKEKKKRGRQQDAQVAFRLDKKLLSDFRSINKSNSANDSDVIRSLIQEYVNRHKDLL